MQLEQSPELPEGPPIGEFAHGFDGHAAAPQLAPPTMVVECNQEARPNMVGSCRAHEVHDTPGALRAKVKLLAEMLRKATHSVAYTGAGISTAAGIPDYASKAGERSSVLPKQPSNGTPFAPGTSIDSEPTYAHRALVALHRSGLLEGGWVQQNHDALAQKAGFPQELLNEIHGGWFDPSNPVVPMDGSLRKDLVRRLKQSRETADLVLVMGTSLSGASADGLVSDVGRRRVAAKASLDGTAGASAGSADEETRAEVPAGSTAPLPLGAVIVNIQQTRLDHLAALRIFATCDEVMALLASELELEVQSSTAGAFPSTTAKEPAASELKCSAAARPRPTKPDASSSVPVASEDTSRTHPDDDVWRDLPYDAATGERLPREGNGSDARSTTLDLRVGKRVRLGRGNAPMASPGLEGVVAAEKTAQGHYRIEFCKEGGEIMLCHLGTWMLEAAAEGRLDMLPLMGC